MMRYRNAFGICILLSFVFLMPLPALAAQSSNITVNATISADASGSLLNIIANASHAELGEVNSSTGFANYTIYNASDDSVYGTANQPMSFNGTDWVNTSIDISGFSLGDYYVKVNATYSSTSEWNLSNATENFSAGAIIKTRNNEDHQNATTTRLNYTSTHGSQTVGGSDGSMSYRVLGEAISGSLPWDGSVFTAIVDFSSLAASGYVLEMNATHYNLINTTNYAFSIQNFSGYVKDVYAVAENNNIAGAQVTLTQSSNSAALSDSGGEYSMKIMNFSALVPTMQATMAGFVTNTTGAYSTIYLSGNSTLNGTVNELGGSPISGVTVSAYNNTSSALMYRTTTNAAGFYSITIRGDAAYYVNYTAGGYNETTMNNSGAGYTGTQTINLELKSNNYAYFNVTVKDSLNGRPIPGANVTLYKSEYQNTKETDSNGSAIIKVIGSTGGGTVNYYANISHPDYNNTYSIAVGDIKNGQTTTKNFTMSGATYFNGYIKDEYGGAALSGVSVNLTTYSGDSLLGYGTYYYTSTTGSNGWFNINIPTSLLASDSGINVTLSGYTEKHIGVVGITSKSKWPTEDAIKISGTNRVEGVVSDAENSSYLVGGAYARIYVDGSVKYTNITNTNGEFLIYVDGNSNFTLSVTGEGYYPFSNVSVMNVSVDYGTIALTGGGVLRGSVTDYQNSSIKISGASVVIAGTAGSPLYAATTDSNGNYAKAVRLGVTYNVSAEKNGYDKEYVQSYLSGDSFGAVETINFALRGKNRIYGTITDSENGEQIENAIIRINDTTNSGTYTATTNSSGSFGIVYIPSTAAYNISFEKEGYITKDGCAGGSCGPNDGQTLLVRNLTGATHVEGVVKDMYSSYPVGGASITIEDIEQAKTYSTTTDADGKYSADTGFDSNYRIIYAKTGYTTLADMLYGGGFPYDKGNLGNNDIYGKTTYLRGTTKANVTIIDKLTQTPVSGGSVTIMPESGEYHSVTDINGNAVVYINGASGSYSIDVVAYGYPQNTVTGLAGNQTMTINLSAKANVRVTDNAAYGAYRHLSGASVSSFYNYTTSLFSYTLGETTVSVTAGCSGYQRENITIELIASDGLYYDSKTLVSDNDTAIFNMVPKGNYNISLNATEYGCGLLTAGASVPSGGAAYNFSYDINRTQARVLLEYPAGTGVSGAFVVLGTDSSINCTTDATGICTLDFVPDGKRTFNITHGSYLETTLTKTIDSGALNSFTSTPVLMQPYPGNVSFLITNATGNSIQNANVTLVNGTESISALTDESGYANFTNVVNVYNGTVNGTGAGYMQVSFYNLAAIPNTTTEAAYTLYPTRLLITVLNASSAISDSNVTLWGGADMAQSASGAILTGKTNVSGQITFSYVKAGYYTLTINKTESNYTLFNSTNVLYWFPEQIMDVTYHLNETYIDLYVRDPEGNPLQNINITLNTTGNPSGLTDSDGFLSTRAIEGISDGTWINVTVNGTETGYNYTNVTVFATNGSNPQYVTLYPNELKISLKNSTGSPIGGVAVTVTPQGGIKYTDETGYANYTALATGTYSVFLNGSSLGYNTSSESDINIEGVVSKEYVLSENYIVSTVTDDLGVLVDDGVNVLWGESENTTTTGNATLHYVSGGLQTFEADGTSKGYGKATYQETVVLGVQTNASVQLGITRIKVYVFNETGAIENANVSVRNTSWTELMKNGKGEYMNGLTDATGWITFEYVPEAKYIVNVTTPNLETNYSYILPQTGVNNTVSLYANKYVSVGGQNNITFNVTDSTGSGIEGVNVSVEYYSNRSYAGSGLTNSSGIAVLDISSSETYNFIIDGEARGRSKSTQYFVPLGMVLLTQNTSSNGIATLDVMGTGNYYITVDAPGYYLFDSEALGIPFNGTHNSELSDGEYRGVFGDVEANLTGSTKVGGVVADMHFLSTPTPGVPGTLENSSVEFYTSSSYTQPSLRYKTTTDENGTFLINISSKNTDTNITQQYYISIADDGYSQLKWPMSTYLENTEYDNNYTLEGERSFTGSIYSINTGELVRTGTYVTLSLVDSELCGTSSECDAYRNPAPITSGQFSFKVRSGRTYNLTINAPDYDVLKTAESVDGKYYVYPAGNGVFLFTINTTDGNYSNKDILINNSENATFGTYTTDASGRITYWLYLGGSKQLNFTVDGSPYGYSTIAVAGETYSAGNTYDIPVSLNITYANITVMSDSGSYLDGVLINFSGVDFINTTVGGSATFSKVPAGTYNMTFTGIDLWYAVPGGVPQITVSNAGGWNTATYTVNETQYEIRAENITTDPIENMSITLTGPSLRQNATHPGVVLFEKIIPGTYNLTFDDTQVYEYGYYPPASPISTDVVGGNDAASGNTKTITFNTTDGFAFAKITTLSGANATLWYNGTIIVDSEEVGSQGYVFLSTNVSEYNSNLTATVSKSGYYTETTEVFGLSNKEVKKYAVSLTPVSGPAPPPCSDCGGGGGGSTRSSTTTIMGSAETIKPSIKATVTPVYVDAGSCQPSYATVENTGKVSLNNIIMKIESAAANNIEIYLKTTVPVLDAGAKETLEFEVCAGKYALPGNYTKASSIKADEIETPATISVVLAREYSEILNEQLASILERIYATDPSILDERQKGYYETAKTSAIGAKDAISSADYEQAEQKISDALDALAKMEQATVTEEKNAIAVIQEYAKAYIDAYGYWLLAPFAIFTIIAVLLMARGKWQKPDSDFILPEMTELAPIRISPARKPILPEHVKREIETKSETKTPPENRFNVFHAMPVGRAIRNAEKFLTDSIEEVVETKCANCGGKIFKGSCIWCGTPAD